MIIGLSMKETAQIAIFDRLKKREITQAAAAKSLGMTIRWVRTKFKRFLAQGAKGLIHLSRNRSTHRRWDVKERNMAMELCNGLFAGFGPTFAAEKLKDLYGIDISRETLRKEMIHEGLWKGKKQKAKHREQRERKAYYGEMAQLDGSPHDWFEGRGPRCTLINFVDDATSRIPYMMLAPNESYDTVFAALYRYIELNGLPKSIYVDYGGVFSVNTNNPDREKITQFKRACDELGIDLIFANSPQAKGRVERSHGTHQDRLVKEMRLNGISDMEAANEFILNTYLPKHNAKFAVDPLYKSDIHKSANHLNLNQIICLKETRILQNDYTLSYKKRILQLTKYQQAVVRPKSIIMIHEHLDSSLDLFIRNINLAFIELKARPKKIHKPQGEQITKQQDYIKPAANHPWRSSYKGVPRVAATNGGY